MSEWGWVAFGFSVAYGSIALYFGWTAVRIRRAKRLLKELSS